VRRGSTTHRSASGWCAGCRSARSSGGLRAGASRSTTATTGSRIELDLRNRLCFREFNLEPPVVGVCAIVTRPVARTIKTPAARNHERRVSTTFFIFGILDLDLTCVTVSRLLKGW
jgi:hypothetical protein